MARSQNKIETVEVRIRTTPAVIGYLDDLVSGQLHGKNRAEVAEQLVRNGIVQLIDKGTLRSVPTNDKFE